MKLNVFIIALLLVSACSSSYIPSDQMLAYKKNMSQQEAQEILQKTIWSKGLNQGVCGARGFWYDDKSAMRVENGGISILAHKRGRQIKKHNPLYKSKAIIVYEKQYYMYQFEFNKITSIEIYDDPLRLSRFPYCNDKNRQSPYRVLDLFVDKTHNFKFMLDNNAFDKVMAALSLLVKNKPVYLH